MYIQQWQPRTLVFFHSSPQYPSSEEPLAYYKDCYLQPLHSYPAAMAIYFVSQ